MSQTSEQLSDYMFCRECEDRLNKNGERWVLANIPQDYDAPFPLRTALESLPPMMVTEEVDLYEVTGSVSFDMDKLIYFAISVFWRGAIHDWQTIGGLKSPPIELCEYEEPLRKFLMGEIPLPNDVVVTIDLWHARKVLQALHPPQPAHLPDCQKYWFYIPGLVFSIYIGEAIPVDIRRRSALRNVVCVDVPEITSIWELTKSLIRSQTVGPKAKLLLDEIAAIRAKAAPKT